MKRSPFPIPSRLILLSAGACLLAAAHPGISADDPVQDQPPDDQRAKLLTFMRAKLESSQSVLEGLVTDNFDKVLTGAEKMAVMSTAAEWYAVPGEDYKRRSEVFRAAAQRLAQMAEAKNGDGAALAYLQLTMSCIDCHRAVRGPGVASQGQDSFQLPSTQPSGAEPQRRVRPL